MLVLDRVCLKTSLVPWHGHFGASGFPAKLQIKQWGVTIEANLQYSTIFLETWRNHFELKLYNHSHGTVALL